MIDNASIIVGVLGRSTERQCMHGIGLTKVMGGRCPSDATHAVCGHSHITVCSEHAAPEDVRIRQPQPGIV